MNTNLKPILKWAGGKRQLLHDIIRYLPAKKYDHYIEPFLGGGAVLFALQPHKAIINDINCELINLYNVIKENPEELITVLKDYSGKHSEKFYYDIRELDRDKVVFSKLDKIKKAARTVYLNRTCYNGLFRVNRAGCFNTPIGRYKNPDICNVDTIKAINEYFNKNSITICNRDYKEIINKAKIGDFVYLDPPYDPINETSNFTAYTASVFDKKEQEALKTKCDFLNKKGINFMVSNSNTDFIKDLYCEYNVIEIRANRNINSKGKDRTNAVELIITNYTNYRGESNAN